MMLRLSSLLSGLPPQAQGRARGVLEELSALRRAAALAQQQGASPRGARGGPPPDPQASARFLADCRVAQVEAESRLVLAVGNALARQMLATLDDFFRGRAGLEDFYSARADAEVARAAHAAPSAAHARLAASVEESKRNLGRRIAEVLLSGNASLAEEAVQSARRVEDESAGRYLAAMRAGSPPSARGARGARGAGGFGGGAGLVAATQAVRAAAGTAQGAPTALQDWRSPSGLLGSPSGAPRAAARSASSAARASPPSSLPQWRCALCECPNDPARKFCMLCVNPNPSLNGDVHADGMGLGSPLPPMTLQLPQARGMGGMSSPGPGLAPTQQWQAAAAAAGGQGQGVPITQSHRAAAYLASSAVGGGAALGAALPQPAAAGPMPKFDTHLTSLRMLMEAEALRSQQPQQQ